jgi:catechol 2,3-dioxygenase-like lactoylglutathione lyase family enzyme
MLAASPATTILPVVDPERARRFYAERLGLEPRGTSPDGKQLFALQGSGLLALLPKPPGAQAEHTALSFEVPDVVEAIRALEARGVVFEDYDLPGLTTVDHVCILGSEKAAWFKDTEGNLLCVHEIVGSRRAAPSA